MKVGEWTECETRLNRLKRVKRVCREARVCRVGLGEESYRVDRV